METISGILFILVAVHFFTLILHDYYRLAKLRRYLKTFRDQGVLSPSDYYDLQRRFAGVFTLLEPLPDEFDYPRFSENLEFMDFVERSQKIRKYLFISLIAMIPMLLYTAPH